MKDMFFTLAAIGAAAAGSAAGWLGGTLRRSRLRALPQEREVCLGAAEADAGAALPKVIWTYWHEGSLPLVVSRCIDGWRRLNPDWRVEVLSPARLQEFLPRLPQGLERLNIAKQTDWIRLALLHRHGGVWMDASIILTRPLDWIEQRRSQAGADLLAFYLDGYTVQPQYPVIESWFLAALPGSRFVAEWLELFEREAVVGETADYLQALQSQGRYEALTQKIGDPSYHTIHVAAQDVLQRCAPGQGPWRLALLCAEDSAYWLQVQAGWRRRALFLRLLAGRGDAGLFPALVKLRGGERRKLEPWLRRGWYRSDSLIGQTLGRPKAAR